MVDINISSIYYSPENPIAGNISVFVKKGGKLTVCGGSGRGKSTLLRAVAGLHSGYY